jgi:hypothetical protein
VLFVGRILPLIGGKGKEGCMGIVVEQTCIPGQHSRRKRWLVLCLS